MQGLQGHRKVPGRLTSSSRSMARTSRLWRGCSAFAIALQAAAHGRVTQLRFGVRCAADPHASCSSQVNNGTG